MDSVKKEKKWTGVRRAIVHREKQQVGFITGGGTLSGGWRIVRELTCGHTMVEPDGGKAALAQFALCRECAKRNEDA